jgi:hypothetical protein
MQLLDGVGARHEAGNIPWASSSQIARTMIDRSIVRSSCRARAEYSTVEPMLPRVYRQAVDQA